MTKTLEKGQKVFFNREKSFEYVKNLGNGGTGQTNLFFDKDIGLYFAIKKYVPINESQREELYKRFVDEIKILFRLSNENIVRIYNYYLYSENFTGYLQMEYIDGVCIDEYDFHQSPKNIDDFFVEAVKAFEYLESKKILHRDIRASNFMIDKDNKLKIIDFGFGKDAKEISEKYLKEKNSIVLNWPYEPPEEIINGASYDFCTEIYYLGKMFKYINKGISKYNSVINKMCSFSREERYKNFTEVVLDVSTDLIDEISFSEEEKETYKEIANFMSGAISKFTTPIKYISSIDEIIQNIYNVIKANALENTVQNNISVISCFLATETDYHYYKNWTVSVEGLKEFYKLLRNSDENKAQIIIDNIRNRIGNIKVELSELPNEELVF